MRRSLRAAPARLTTGAFIFHSGLNKWRGDEATATGVHAMAAGAYPFLADVAPRKFLKALAAAEIAVGAVLLVPLVPTRFAGAVLTAFSGGLMGLYFRTPGLRKPRSVWPTPGGMAISKDVWLLGTGLTLAAFDTRT